MQFGKKKYTPFTCFWGDVYWNWIISILADPQYLKFGPVVFLWSFFQIPQVWLDLDSSRKCYVQSPTMTQFWTVSIERTCMTCHMSLFPPLALKMIERKLNSVYLQQLFTTFQSDAKRESYEDFPLLTSLRWNSGAWKSTTFHRSYLRKYFETSYEIFWRCSLGFFIRTLKILASKPS